MTTKATMGIDFLGVGDGAAPSTPGAKSSSTRGVQYSMLKLNKQQGRAGATLASHAAEELVDGSPEILHCFSVPPSADKHRRFRAPMPLRSPASRSAAEASPGAVSPLTIFYNGAVATFDLPPDKAEAVIKCAAGTSSTTAPTFSPDGCGRQQERPPTFSPDQLGGDLPLARKRSLQRFLEKRAKTDDANRSACTVRDGRNL